MKNNFQFAFKTMLVFIMGFGITSSFAADQGWNTKSLSLKANDKLTLALSQESRYQELTYLGSSFLSNVQAGFIYKLPHNLYIGLAYKREHQERSTFTSYDNRIIVDSGRKSNITGNLNLDTRLRFEFRNYEQPQLEDHMMYRLMFKFSYKLKLGNLNLSPFIASEPFGDTKDASQQFINRHRLYAGTGVSLMEHVGFVVNYIRQDLKHSETLHILSTGIKLSF
ncbi:MAG: DUF2490 domain-containing protein [Calditrichaceae bacterium]